MRRVGWDVGIVVMFSISLLSNYESEVIIITPKVASLPITVSGSIDNGFLYEFWQQQGPQTSTWPLALTYVRDLRMVSNNNTDHETLTLTFCAAQAMNNNMASGTTWATDTNIPLLPPHPAHQYMKWKFLIVMCCRLK